MRGIRSSHKGVRAYRKEVKIDQDGNMVFRSAMLLRPDKKSDVWCVPGLKNPVGPVQAEIAVIKLHFLSSGEKNTTGKGVALWDGF